MVKRIMKSYSKNTLSSNQHISRFSRSLNGLCRSSFSFSTTSLSFGSSLSLQMRQFMANPCAKIKQPSIKPMVAMTSVKTYILSCSTSCFVNTLDSQQCRSATGFRTGVSLAHSLPHWQQWDKTSTWSTITCHSLWSLRPHLTGVSQKPLLTYSNG